MRTKIFAVWILIFVTVFAIVGLVFWKISQPRNPNRYELRAQFETVSGLKEGATVRFRGMVIGNVRRIIVNPQYVEVSFLIGKEIKLPVGSIVQIGSQGLAGESYLEIVPSSASAFLAPGSVLEGKSPVDLTELQVKALVVLSEIVAIPF